MLMCYCACTRSPPVLFHLCTYVFALPYVLCLLQTLCTSTRSSWYTVPSSYPPLMGVSLAFLPSIPSFRPTKRCSKCLWMPLTCTLGSHRTSSAPPPHATSSGSRAGRKSRASACQQALNVLIALSIPFTYHSR